MSRGFGPYSMYDTSAMSSQSNMFSGFDDSMMPRVDALSAVPEMKPHQQIFKHDVYAVPDIGYGPGAKMHQMQVDFSHGDSMVDQMNAIGPNGFMMSHDPHGQQIYASMCTHPNGQHHQQMGYHGGPVKAAAHDAGLDSRELEAFAERFKQRRIKLGVTQADVGRALGNLKIAGIGSLSQSTICRFESLTLSHNNMVALKPVLLAWLEEAERIAREKRGCFSVDAEGHITEKKRKRTSIAAPEKRSLEAYFAIQPRPSGDKISQIAEKLDLKKNVVRVWFCNQRQKQKRMKFASAAAVSGGGRH